MVAYLDLKGGCSCADMETDAAYGHLTDKDTVDSVGNSDYTAMGDV